MRDLLSKPIVKRFNLLVLLLFFCCHIIVAQTDSITLVPHWSKGDSKRYEIVRSSSFTKGGAVRLANSKTQFVTLKVARVRDNLIDMIWKFDDSKYFDSVSIADPLLVLLQTIDNGIEVKYTTNVNGTIKSITNYDEISSMIKLKTDSIVQLLSKKANVDQSKIDDFKFKLSLFYGTNQALDATLLGDIYQYHQLYGRTYSTTSMNSIPDNISSPVAVGSQNSLNLRLSYDPVKRYYFATAREIKPSLEQMYSQMHIVRKINRFYQFEFPGNWLIEYTSSPNSLGPMSPKLDYKLRMLK